VRHRCSLLVPGCEVSVCCVPAWSCMVYRQTVVVIKCEYCSQCVPFGYISSFCLASYFQFLSIHHCSPSISRKHFSGGLKNKQAYMLWVPDELMVCFHFVWNFRNWMFICSKLNVPCCLCSVLQFITLFGLRCLVWYHGCFVSEFATLITLFMNYVCSRPRLYKTGAG